MSQIALSVALECEPGMRDDVVQSLMEHRKRCLRQEPGTLQFEVMTPMDDLNAILLFELYADEAALAAHASGSSIAQQRGEVKAKIKRAVATKCLHIDPTAWNHA
jgi:(4S)-4-hydroxy-5-phosphonooxypentane-2,3-dione isomerase